MSRMAAFRSLPGTLETGVTAYIPTEIFAHTSTNQGGGIIVGELINFGSLNISTNTFTDGSAMPTRTIFNTSTAMCSPIFMEVEVALNATPGTLVVTYVDQNGNTAEASTSHTLTASAIPGSTSTVVLNTTDWGARDVTNAVRSAGTTPTGTIRFWGIVPIAIVPEGNGTAGLSVGGSIDLLNSGIVRRLAAATVIGGFRQTTGAMAELMLINYVGDA